MKLHLEKDGRNRNLIDAYTSGRITVNQVHYTESLILTPDQMDKQWPPRSFSDLEPGHLSRLLEFGPEIILIGTGIKTCFLPPVLAKPIIEANIGYEAMDTAAACRTYNILVTEGRTVVAGLMINGSAE